MTEEFLWLPNILASYIHAQNPWRIDVRETKAWKLTKENNNLDIFHGFKSPGNQMKWLELRLRAFSWQPCSKSALFPLYKLQFMQVASFPVLRNRKKWIFELLNCSNSCSFLNVRKYSVLLIKCYLLHTIFTERWALQKQAYLMSFFFEWAMLLQKKLHWND